MMTTGQNVASTRPSKSTKPNSAATLAPEVLFAILNADATLTLPDLLNCSCVCKSWRAAVLDDSTWKTYIADRYPKAFYTLLAPSNVKCSVRQVAKLQWLQERDVERLMQCLKAIRGASKTTLYESLDTIMKATKTILESYQAENDRFPLSARSSQHPVAARFVDQLEYTRDARGILPLSTRHEAGLLLAHFRWHWVLSKFADASTDLETGLSLMSYICFPNLDPPTQIVAPISRALDLLAAQVPPLDTEDVPGAPDLGTYTGELAQILRSKPIRLMHWLFSPRLDTSLKRNMEFFQDLRNIFLDTVLNTRRGIPLSLCAIYSFVGKRLGFEIGLIGLPSVVMACTDVQLDQPDGTTTSIRVYIDPTTYSTGHGIGVYTRDHFQQLMLTYHVPFLDDFLSPTDFSAILARHINNLQAFLMGSAQENAHIAEEANIFHQRERLGRQQLQELLYAVTVMRDAVSFAHSERQRDGLSIMLMSMRLNLLIQERRWLDIPMSRSAIARYSSGRQILNEVLADAEQSATRDPPSTGPHDEMDNEEHAADEDDVTVDQIHMHPPGTIFKHILYGYVAVICQRNAVCRASEEWKRTMRISSLARGARQPFYHSFVVNDGSTRYVAHDNVQPLIVAAQFERFAPDFTVRMDELKFKSWHTAAHRNPQRWVTARLDPFADSENADLHDEVPYPEVKFSREKQYITAIRNVGIWFDYFDHDRQALVRQPSPDSL